MHSNNWGNYGQRHVETDLNYSCQERKKTGKNLNQVINDSAPFTLGASRTTSVDQTGGLVCRCLRPALRE